MIIMIRTIILICTFVYSFSALAHPESKPYQIDLIVFTHTQNSNDKPEVSLPPFLTPNKTNQAIPLRYNPEDKASAYQLLSSSASHLRKEYWALKHRSQYQVLGHYSWMQPINNKRPVALPPIHQDDWNVEGTLRIRQNQYYLLDTEFIFKTDDKHQAPFLFSQKQRLKEDVVYYLDHPKAGMLIKIHKVA